MVTIHTERSDFRSRGVRCAAWLTVPPARGPHPAVLLVHGLGATHDMALNQYEQHFAAAGVATLAFDYRTTGLSEGPLRQHLSAREQRADVHAALAYLRSRPEVDDARVALWGTSFGAMHALRAAADDEGVSAVVVQCPIVHGPAAARRLGVWASLQIAPAILDDLLRRMTGRTRRYVPIVGPPGSSAMVTVAGAEAGWLSTLPPGGHFDNRVLAADCLGVVATSSVRHVSRVKGPLLVCVCDRETLMNPRYAERVAHRAPRGAARHYDSDHFEIYHSPLLNRVLADQSAFLREHLGVRP
jgi:pimeloyl-ACP methyl ester carboxylesterase